MIISLLTALKSRLTSRGELSPETCNLHFDLPCFWILLTWGQILCQWDHLIWVAKPRKWLFTQTRSPTQFYALPATTADFLGLRMASGTAVDVGTGTVPVTVYPAWLGFCLFLFYCNYKVIHKLPSKLARNSSNDCLTAQHKNCPHRLTSALAHFLRKI